MEIVKGPIGPEAEYAVKFEGGLLFVEAKHDGAVGGAALKVFVKADAIVDAIKKAIPGQIDDLILDSLKDALVKG